MKKQRLKMSWGEKGILLIGVILIFTVLSIAQIINAKIQYGILTAGQAIILLLLVLIVFISIQWYVQKASYLNRSMPSDRILFVILALSTILPRFFLFFSLSMEQFSDYQTYFITAQTIFLGEELSENLKVYFASISATSPLVATLLSLPFYLLGVSVRSILLYNIFLYMVAVLCFYAIARRFLPKFLAFFASIVLSWWPNNLFSSLYILSEPLYLALLLWGLLLLILGIELVDRRRGASFALFFVAGVILSMSQRVRPVTQIYLISATMLLVINLIKYFKTRRVKDYFIIGTYALVLIGGYLLTSHTISAYTSQFLPVISEPSFGWTLFEGTNPYTYGGWSQETANTLTYVMDNFPIENVQQELLHRAIEQIQTYDMKSFAYLLARKMCTMWANNSGYISDLYYTFANSPESVLYGELPFSYEMVGELSQPVYLVLVSGVIVFMAWVAIQIIRNEVCEFQQLLPLVLPLCGGMILHCFATAIQRYSYVWMPIMILLFFCFVHQYCLYKKNNLR